jgi:hypothetical protein
MWKCGNVKMWKCGDVQTSRPVHVEVHQRLKKCGFNFEPLGNRLCLEHWECIIVCVTGA